MQVVLPIMFNARPDHCQSDLFHLHPFPDLRSRRRIADVTSVAAWAFGLRLTVDVEHRNPVRARWFDIWAGAVAVTAMCTIRGYAGVSGVPSGLSVILELAAGPEVGNETASS